MIIYGEKMIKNIFLDAGGVILDETGFEENMCSIIVKTIQNYNYNYSKDDYWKDAEEAVYRFVPRVYDYILYKYIKDINNFSISKKHCKNVEKKNLNNNFKIMEGIEEFLKKYSESFKIGILGQYGKTFKEYLEYIGLLQYFIFSEIQDNYNVTKPDPRYFEAILKKCGCNAEESIMIGDRIDKDIIPAKLIGMKTIRLRTGLHKNQEPRIPNEIPDLTVNNIMEITIGNIKQMDYCV
jgi:HAD superfamily hydrolase (TIGR01549 family)